MKILYLECNMGAAGDMLAGALLDLLDETKQNEVIDKLNHLGLEGVHVTLENSTKCGIAGKHFRVIVNKEEEKSLDESCDHSAHPLEAEHHHHHHASMASIQQTIESFPLPQKVTDKILNVYREIAEAESYAHQMPVSEVHFHEVGMKDAIIDITAVCVLMDTIGAQQVVVSPVNTGYGEVRCMHGLVPVPAPATEYLLRGIPSYANERFRGELCTPTGAALLKTFGTSFGVRPVMTVERTGYGMGEKDFEASNCVRAFVGETVEKDTPEEIERLETNLDDMTGEEIGFAVERLFEAGAKDVFTSSIQMKKNRPAVLLTVLCAPQDQEAMLRCLFRYTTTLGVRYQRMNRAVLKREMETVAVGDGTVRVKKSTGYGTDRSKAEYEDLAAIAKKTGQTLWEVKKEMDRK